MNNAAIEARLIKNSVVEDAGYSTPCWLWFGARDGHGYARINYREGGKHVAARGHVLSVRVLKGEDTPAGYEVDHLCYNRACVNPDHLVVRTKKENLALRRKR